MESEIVSEIIFNSLKHEFNELSEKDLKNLAKSLQNLILPKPMNMGEEKEYFSSLFPKSFLKSGAL